MKVPRLSKLLAASGTGADVALDQSLAAPTTPAAEAGDASEPQKKARRSLVPQRPAKVYDVGVKDLQALEKWVERSADWLAHCSVLRSYVHTTMKSLRAVGAAPPE